MCVCVRTYVRTCMCTCVCVHVSVQYACRCVCDCVCDCVLVYMYVMYLCTGVVSVHMCPCVAYMLKMYSIVYIRLIQCI